MHTSSMLRMKWFVDTYLIELLNSERELSVIDIGSFDVNGSYKKLFLNPRFSYTGLDMSQGKNVDIVPKNCYNWVEIESDKYDVVISGQCLEHVEFPWVTFYEMCRILKPNGLVCVITPRAQGRHRYPVDTYRYDVDGMAALAKWCNIIPLHISTNEAPINAPASWFSNLGDCMFVGKKPIDWSGTIDVKKYTYEEWPIEKLRTGFIDKSNHPAILFDSLKKLVDSKK